MHCQVLSGGIQNALPLLKPPCRWSSHLSSTTSASDVRSKNPTQPSATTEKRFNVKGHPTLTATSDASGAPSTDATPSAVVKTAFMKKAFLAPKMRKIATGIS